MMYIHIEPTTVNDNCVNIALAQKTHTICADAKYTINPASVFAPAGKKGKRAGRVKAQSSATAPPDI
jgi:hypothetical protein